MKNIVKKTAFVLSAAITMSLIAGCSGNGGGVKTDASGTKTFTAFIANTGTEIPASNRMYNKIAEKTGVKVEVTYLTGQSVGERIGVMIAGGQYPDFLDGTDAQGSLVEAGAFIPLDMYIDDYPNIKKLYNDAEWDRIRNADGHIYYIPQYGDTQGKSMQTQQDGEAFWIQKQVLAWDGYSQPHTLNEYFDLIERFIAENPTGPDGQRYIGFSILCDDWRYFCLENVPQFLAGYPNDGCAIVDPETRQVLDYNTIPEAKIYYDKLNEEYNKGLIDPETFTLSYDQYLAKIASGRVLGMVDQHWQFQSAEESLVQQGHREMTYVPLGIVAEAGTTDKYFTPRTLNPATGLGITTSCKDVPGALKFLNDILEPEIETLRFWGEEGVDYLVDESTGLNYRTQDMRDAQTAADWATNNKCEYVWFPHYEGMLSDLKNAVLPSEQPSEFIASLSEFEKDFLAKYGYGMWTDFLTPVEKNTAWFPLYSQIQDWTADTTWGLASIKMDEVKHEWLPKVVMASRNKFDKTWDDYMETYGAKVDSKAYTDRLTEIVDELVSG